MYSWELCEKNKFINVCPVPWTDKISPFVPILLDHIAIYKILFWPSLIGQDDWILASFYFFLCLDLIYLDRKELGQTPAILTEQAWSITHIHTVHYLKSFPQTPSCDNYCEGFFLPHAGFPHYWSLIPNLSYINSISNALKKFFLMRICKLSAGCPSACITSAETVSRFALAPKNLTWCLQ